MEMDCEGLYFFTAQVVDEEGVLYDDSFAIAIISGEQLDMLLKAKWDDVKTALIAGDIETALRYHNEKSHEKYTAIYNALGAHLPTLVAQMQNLSWIGYADGTAKYRIRQDHDVEGQIVTITYVIYFSRGRNGIWSIEKY